MVDIAVRLFLKAIRNFFKWSLRSLIICDLIVAMHPMNLETMNHSHIII